MKQVDIVQPSKKEVVLAQASRDILIRYMRAMRKPAIELKLLGRDGKTKKIAVPRIAIHLLADILAQMAQGRSIKLLSLRNELTTQEAADLLNVSRPFLIKLLKHREIPYRKVGNRRKLLAQDVLTYKHSIDKKRRATLDELTQLSQDLKLGYE